LDLKVSVSTVGGGTGTHTRGEADVEFQSRVSGFKMKITAVIIKSEVPVP